MSPDILINEAKPNLTLADAFFSQEQAQALRNKLGAGRFSNQQTQVKKAKRLELPKEFCFKFIEEHPLKQSNEFHLWKTTLLKEIVHTCAVL